MIPLNRVLHPLQSFRIVIKIAQMNKTIQFHRYYLCEYLYNHMALVEFFDTLFYKQILICEKMLNTISYKCDLANP